MYSSYRGDIFYSPLSTVNMVYLQSIVVMALVFYCFVIVVCDNSMDGLSFGNEK